MDQVLVIVHPGLGKFPCPCLARRDGLAGIDIRDLDPVGRVVECLILR